MGGREVVDIKITGDLYGRLEGLIRALADAYHSRGCGPSFCGCCRVMIWENRPDFRPCHDRQRTCFFPAIGVIAPYGGSLWI